jgi:cytochrome c1
LAVHVPADLLRDDSRPYGVNNLVFANVGMPHVLLPLQGLIPSVSPRKWSTRAATVTATAWSWPRRAAWTRETFDQTVYDLVNFLAYVAEPVKADRHRIGIYALLFIAVFFVFAMLLNREYWKDVH